MNDEHTTPSSPGEEPMLLAGLSERAFAEHLRQVMDQEPIGPHPDSGSLIALREGSLTPAEEEPLLAHLGRCRECSDFLGFYALAGDELVVTRQELDQAWQGLARPLGAHAPEPILEREADPLETGARRAPWALGPWLRRVLGLDTPSRPMPWRFAVEIAGIALMAVVAGQWLEQRALVDTLSQPEANFATFAPISPQRAVHRGPSEGPVDPGLATRDEVDDVFHVTLEPGQASFNLAFPQLFEVETLHIRLLDAAGELRWQSDGLTPDPHGVATLRLHRHFLTEGPYTLELSDAQDPAIPLRRYTLHWTSP